MFPYFIFCRKGAVWCGKFWTVKSAKTKEAKPLYNARDKHEERHSES